MLIMTQPNQAHDQLAGGDAIGLTATKILSSVVATVYCFASLFATLSATKAHGRSQHVPQPKSRQLCLKYDNRAAHKRLDLFF